jgi:hypothetical protein
MRIASQSLWLAMVLIIPAPDALSAADDFSGKVVGVVRNEACAWNGRMDHGPVAPALCQVGARPWGVAAGGCYPAVKELPLKGTGEARCRPPRGQA